jgi:5S rRNA maturation endonuclease (ribonuclease M5)
MSCHAKGDVKGYVADPIMELDYAMSLLEELDLVKPESWLDQFDSGSAHEYWLSRFPEEICNIYRLGWDGTEGKPCYPIRDMTGRPLGVVHRNIDDPEGPKYKYPRGVKKTELLFGIKELQQSEYVFLVEGAMDVCAVRETGHDAIGSYGSLLDKKQVMEIVALQPRVVFLAFDNDRAGRIGTGHAEWSLNIEGIMTRRVFWNDKWNDLAEMDLVTRSNTLSKALASKSQRV